MDGIHPLIYFEYRDKEDMFDAHSYNKGGMVLHMLRSYIGDEAFFAGLKRYLNDNAYTDVEADELRLAFEDVVGEDLNWFFNQWYFEAGHPQMMVDYGYLDGQVTVTVEQVQDPEVQPAIFQMPTTIDIYMPDGTKVREKVWVKERLEIFTFDVDQEPALVSFDGDRTLLCEMSDNKTEEQYVFQYKHSENFLDRWEALEELKGSTDAAARNIFNAALADPFWSIRAQAVENCSKDGRNLMTLQKLAESDPHSAVREAALYALIDSDAAGNTELAQRVIQNEQAYHVVAAALQLLNANNSAAALKAAKKLENENSSDILATIGEIYVETGDIKYLTFFEENWDKVEFFSAITFMQLYGQLAAEGDVDQMLSSGKKLAGIGSNMGQSPWKRFGSTNALNGLHANLTEMLSDSMLPEETKTKIKDADNQLVKLIEQVKAAETNPQLQAFYQGLPNPPANP